MHTAHNNLGKMIPARPFTLAAAQGHLFWIVLPVRMSKSAGGLCHLSAPRSALQAKNKLIGIVKQLEVLHLSAAYSHLVFLSSDGR